ncbi:MAG: protein kinase domain-containing protein, partial [Thermoanaerobaculia bacterium]
MTIAAGSRLGPYEILSPLGAGGMGEVYRARDKKLDREVAIKVLPEAVAEDAASLARFEREARLLASLNHPGIATLHGLETAEGVRFLVMELVAGETLAFRIARGALPAEEAVPLFLQMAEALEAAHERGIVHRDLKPANVMVTPEEKVKILDFGLAKVFEAEAPEGDISHSPTITREATRAGVVLGTAAYMSPEQARGKKTDKRTDIWAFGCCLYEALTGGKPFSGETVTDVLAAIVRSEPDWETLPAATTPRLRELLRRCLAKDPHERLRDIGDARIELERAGEPAGAEAVPVRRGPAWVVVGGLAAVLAGVVLGRALFSRGPSSVPPVMRTTIQLPNGQRMPRLWYLPLAISEDGRRLAYAALTKDGVRLYRRPLDSFESTPVLGTEDAMMPFFSPDGEWVGFFTGGRLKMVAWAGGTPITLATARIPVGGTWGPDGTIVFTPTQNSGLWRVSAEGGVPEELTRPDFHEKGYTHAWPQYVDDGKKILYIQWTSRPSLLDLASRKSSAVLRVAESPVFVATDRLLFADLGRGLGLFGARFDPARPETIGPAAPVLDGVRLVFSESGRAWIASSKTGTLVYA